MRKISRSGIRTHYIAQTSPTLRGGNGSRNSKNDISDVIFNYFYFDSRKVLRIKAGVLTVKIQHRVTREQLMYNARLFVVLSAWRYIVGASPELKFRTTDEANTAHVVSGLLTAHKP